MRLDSVVEAITNSSSEAFMLPSDGTVTGPGVLDAMTEALTDAAMAGDADAWPYLVTQLDASARASIAAASRDEILDAVTADLSRPPSPRSRRDQVLDEMGLYGKAAPEIATAVVDRLAEIRDAGGDASDLSRSLGLGWRVGRWETEDGVQFARFAAQGRDGVRAAARQWVHGNLDVTVAPFAVSVHSGESHLPSSVRELLRAMGGVPTDT